MLEKQIAHLGFVQGIIARMGTNSFLLKGWSVTLVAALFALSSKDSNREFVVLAYFPVLLFWLLDAFFLWQENLYRELYENIARDQSLSEQFSLSTDSVKAEVRGMPFWFFSKTIFPFYGLIAFLIACTLVLR
jgi:hypothetical protein